MGAAQWSEKGKPDGHQPIWVMLETTPKRHFQQTWNLSGQYVRILAVVGCILRILGLPAVCAIDACYIGARSWVRAKVVAAMILKAAYEETTMDKQKRRTILGRSRFLPEDAKMACVSPRLIFWPEGVSMDAPRTEDGRNPFHTTVQKPHGKIRSPTLFQPA